MKFKQVGLIILFVIDAITIAAQTPYFSIDELPDATYYLPAPPDTTGALFDYDISQFHWGKSMRDSDRGKQAVDDANGIYTVMCQNFSQAFGMLISPEHTPAIYEMIACSLKTTSNATSKCKNHYRRVRPFQYFDEEMYTGETLSDTSYPSTHAAKGWIMALLLGEINPDAQQELAVKGYEYGQSRVIVGAHWQTDVDAGRLVGSITCSLLHSNSTFLAHMDAAKAEFASLINDAVIDTHPDSNAGDNHLQWYTIDGRPAHITTPGIIVGSNGKKILHIE